MVDVPGFRFGSGDVLKRMPTDLTYNGEDRIHPWQSATWPLQKCPIAAADGSKIGRVMETHIRSHLVEHTDSTKQKFWPPKLLDHIFGEEAVRQVVQGLVACENLPTREGRNSEYWVGIVCGHDGRKQEFRKVLVLLLLLRRETCIGNFISLNLADHCLPLKPEDPVFGEWSISEAEQFCNTYQWMVNVPFLEPSQTKGEVFQLDIIEDHIRPWARIYSTSQRITPGDPSAALSMDAASSMDASTSSMDASTSMRVGNQHDFTTLVGGNGEVHRIIIHPWQHDFDPSNKNIFALKRLFSRNREVFRRETAMLKRFGGRHENIVTLLATIACKEASGPDQYYLLFPWADSDLWRYWMDHPKPDQDRGIFQWIAQQCFDIATALAVIHDPQEQNSEGQQLHGRHGDIKPANILWFASKGGPNGLLVLSDLGLAEVHRDKSRSNIPGQGIPVTPNYRPPECDMHGSKGFISRAFDIWTLGCLFLEFIVWALGGWKAIDRFRQDRCRSVYINGVGTDVYFDVRPVPDNITRWAFAIKSQVTECISRLHAHADCTAYLHDFLDLIQEEMIVVIPNQRIKAPELVTKMERLRNETIGEVDIASRPELYSGRTRPIERV